MSRPQPSAASTVYPRLADSWHCTSKYVCGSGYTARVTLVDLPSTKPALVAFDLDDTLAPSKSALPPEMVHSIQRLLRHTSVCIISGGQFEQFDRQVLTELAGTEAKYLTKLHLMPTCGTQYYTYSDGQWIQEYSESLAPDQKQRALAAAEQCAHELGLWESDTWGPILEDRQTQITFSALGQQAPVDEKAAWDPDGTKKHKLRDAIALVLPDLEVRAGGSTSVDITRRGIDKAYGIQKLADATKYSLDDMLFIGDKLEAGGNDHPVLSLGVACHAVDSWQDTRAYLDDSLIPMLSAK